MRLTTRLYGICLVDPSVHVFFFLMYLLFLVIFYTQYCCLQLCQDHSVSVFSSVSVFWSVYGVCYCGLAVWHQLLPLLDSRG